MMVHRLLEKYLTAPPPPKGGNINPPECTHPVRAGAQAGDNKHGQLPPLMGGEAGALEDLCKQASKMEKLAEEAERASVKYKQVQFLQDRVGEEFEGIISGVTEWGIFVELVENKCEGMIRLRDMQDDYYVFDQENYRIVGKRRGKVIQLGDKVRVIVKRADLVKKQLDFEMV